MGLIGEKIEFELEGATKSFLAPLTNIVRCIRTKLAFDEGEYHFSTLN